jgi:hypothetical protein
MSFIRSAPVMCPGCKKPVTLRVRPKLVFTTVIAYVRYECKGCGSVGGLAITELEARTLWAI